MMTLRSPGSGMGALSTLKGRFCLAMSQAAWLVSEDMFGRCGKSNAYFLFDNTDSVVSMAKRKIFSALPI